MSISLSEAMENNHAHISLIAEPTNQTLLLVNAGQEYLVDLTVNTDVTVHAEKFTFASGILTYTGTNVIENHFVGDAVLKSDKNATVILTSYVNGEVTTSTDFVFASANSQGSFSSNSIIPIENGHTIQIKAQSNTANTLLTFVSWKLSYSGYYTCQTTI